MVEEEEEEEEGDGECLDDANGLDELVHELDALVGETLTLHEQDEHAPRHDHTNYQKDIRLLSKHA